MCVALHASHFFLQSQTAFPELKVLLIKLSDGLFYETKLEIRADFGWSGLVGQNEVMNFWYLLTGWRSMMLFFGAYFHEIMLFLHSQFNVLNYEFRSFEATLNVHIITE